jgi:hypothetical protein
MSDPIIKINGTSWSSISNVNGIAKASIVSMSGVPAPPPTQTATLSATKYGQYNTTSNTSFTLAVNALSSNSNSTVSVSIQATVTPSRTGTSYTVSRANLQFDLSSYSTSSILSAKLLLNVNSVILTATPNEVYVLDLGGATFNFPTLNNADYSLVYQSGSLTEYATDTINSTGLYELNFSAAAITEANTFPAAYSMALLTYHDRNDTAPALNDRYQVASQTTSPYQPPELVIEFI